MKEILIKYFEYKKEREFQKSVRQLISIAGSWTFDSEDAYKDYNQQLSEIFVKAQEVNPNTYE